MRIAAIESAHYACRPKAIAWYGKAGRDGQRNQPRKVFSRSYPAVIRVDDDAGNVFEQAGDFKEP